MVQRTYEKHVEPPTKMMTLREYAQYARGIYGPQSINDFMLNVMQVASQGSILPRLEWDKMVVGIKLKHAELARKGNA